MPQTRDWSDVSMNADDPPNVLFVMVDQLMPHLTAAYGHDVVETPNIDRLADEGARFDAAYTPSPMCGPARSCLMTGRHCSEIEAWDNASPLGDDEVTYAHYARDSGYDPVLSGKMHFVGADQLHGFGRRLTTDIYPEDFRWTQPRGVDDRPKMELAQQYIADAIHVDRWSQYLSYDEETHFRALEYLNAKGLEKGDAADYQPFHLTVSYHHPHEPFWPPQEYWDRYEDADVELPELPEDMEETFSVMDEWINHFHGVADYPAVTDAESAETVRRAFYALVTYVDDKVEDLLDSLADNGLLEDTVVVFTSDHGDMLCEKGMVQKRHFYEWSTRIPLLVRFPDGAYAGETCAEPVSLIDLLPTFCDLMGVDERRRLPHDGESLLAVLDGSVTERVIFSEYHAAGVHAPCFMARRGDDKYIYIHGHDEQLFDLYEDPGEWDDRSKRDPETATELRAAIQAEFDPDAIDDAVDESVARRRFLDDVLGESGVDWAHDPGFDESRGILDQYRPPGVTFDEVGPDTGPD